MEAALSKEEAFRLLQMVFIGNWVINASRDKEKQVKEYEEIEQKIFAMYKDLCPGVIEKQGNKYYPTLVFEEQTDEFLNAYEEHVFWDDLAMYLAERDVHKKYEHDKDSKTEEEMTQELVATEKKYLDEFTKHGLDRIHIKG